VTRWSRRCDVKLNEAGAWSRLFFGLIFCLRFYNVLRALAAFTAIFVRKTCRATCPHRVFVYIHGMAQIPQIFTVSSKHGTTTARAIELAITTKTITPKTITKR